jgi:nicotinamidase-related amidase
MTDTADRGDRIDPQHAALLIMDYQPGILGRFDDADALLGRAAEAIAVARRRGAQVGYVRVAFEDDDYAAVPPTNKMFARLAGGRANHDQTPDTAVHERVAPQPGDIIVRKVRVGAFSTTDLDEQLRTRQIDTLILAGVSTSGVVLSTVRDAADRDYRLFVLSDCCADPDPEVHNVLTTKVFARQADVITLADLPALFGATAPR